MFSFFLSVNRNLPDFENICYLCFFIIVSMKARVRYSSFCWWLTGIITAVLVGLCVLTVNEIAVFCLMLLMALCVVVAGLLFGPVAIEANTENVIIRCALRRKLIPVSDIESVKLFQPTMGAIRICGSGGYMGYWGTFREGDIGKYHAYYGKASDCFLVNLKSGKKYLLGCENPKAIVDYINSLINS